ncbi:unnamed protein product [Arctia plantaginis]|uniref:C2H2-type domain-containing protein n=1 Tax=Arctia plantaginis TaxID=874455 RepID=A0A8S0YNH2_ARCPL|nr:unnamed protein product [Arctia plantaginis]
MTTEQKFNCIFCKDVFDNKEDLQVHFRKHADPQFKSKSRFGNEPQMSDEKSKERSEMVSCDVCSQMFPTISKAITHKHKVHPDHDVKYFCPWCGKLFTMKHPYNIHIQSTHDNQEQIESKIFHCDCCDVDFFLPSAMLYHNKFFHRQDSDIPDVGVSKKLKLYNQKHITDDHSDENQSPEEVLRCPLCEAIFYHLDAYEIHLTFHTTEDLYSAQNELFADLFEFSLETVPPMMEKVESRENCEAEVHSQDTDTESNVNAMGIEKFLELAMDQPEDSNSGKVKKKKHKKSKKAAITLDEFLSMNQDVFGEDLDFQGVEELPTRIVKKRVKNKKSVNTVASAELEKLKQKGIVVVKVGASKPSKAAQKKLAKNSTPNRELKTSSEVLTKLMNQSNNQIKIVKKSVPVIIKNETEQDVTTTFIENDKSNQIENDTVTKNISEEETEDRNIVEAEAEINYARHPISPITNSKDVSFSKAKDISLPSTGSGIAINKSTRPSNGEHDTNNIIAKESNDTVTKSVNLEKISVGNLQKLGGQKESLESLNTTFNKQLNQDQSDDGESDSEMCDGNNGTEGIEGNNECINEIEDTSNKNRDELNKISSVSSLSTLKHLGHLTVKPINQINKVPNLDMEISDPKNNDKTVAKIDKEQTRFIGNTDNEITALKPKPTIEKDPTLDALKILSKNITIKSLPVSANRSVDSGSEADKEADKALMKAERNSMKLKNVSGNKNVTIKKIKIETNESAPVAKVINMVNNQPKNIEGTMHSLSKTNKQSTKHLSNITTKVIPPQKNVVSQVVKQTNSTMKIQKDQEIIEISDIDDSDDETAYSIKSEPKQDTTTSTDPLRNLSRHITVKSINQPVQAVPKHIKVENQDEQTDDEDLENDAVRCDSDIPTNAKVCSQKLSSRNIALQYALKNLGKNITVKSGTSSPCHSIKSQDNYSQDSNIDVNEPDDVLDSDLEKVKITELEGNISNDEDSNDRNLEHSDNQPIVESPHDSDSENDEVDNKLLDFEAEISASAVMKTNQEVTTNKNSICLNNLKNISKNLTIKSLNINSDKQEKAKPIFHQETVESAKNQTKPSITKSTKHLVNESFDDETSTSRSLKNVADLVDHASNESLNQKVSVNKEVTVKTFQTKTVIQEITTTVTKTIKTVNQTVKQETKNSSQMSIPVRPQKVQGIRPNTSKNLQGMVIRQACPTAVRPNNNVAQVRPVANVVRPSKQIVPMRASSSVTRPSTPRMSNSKTNLPKSSPNKPVIGKPLKFSPSVMTSALAKRPNTDEVSGPFSCFKKPKESLIPVSDIPDFGGGGDTTVQVKAASQTSSSYMSTSKVVKGNSIVTASQVKSEMSTVHQLSRFNNSASIKVKSALVKQSQENESSSKKQTTLEAIEKLQKQGLLVKKPRIELNENSDYPPDENVGMGYNSDDEQDE